MSSDIVDVCRRNKQPKKDTVGNKFKRV